jgi:hypothetical protein
MSLTIPHTDLVAYDSAKGSIQLPSGKQLRVYPKTATNDFLTALPFSYEQDVAISKIGAFPYYNSDQRVLAFKVLFPPPPQDAIPATQEQLINAYQQPAGTTTSSLIPATKLIPLRIVAYDLLLRVAGKELLLQNDSRIEDGGSFDDEIGVSAKINDDDVHQFLVNHPELVFIIVRTYYLFEADNATTGIVESFSKGVQDAFSSVFPNAAPDQNLIVNRDAVDRLKAKLGNSVLVELHIPTASTNAPFVTDLIKSYLANLKAVQISDLQTATAKIRLYGPDQAYVEMQPQEYKNLTTSWETSQDVLNSLEQTWDKLADFATHTDDDQSFHDQVANYVKGEGGASASANILQFGGSGSFNIHYEKNWSDLSSSDKHDVSDAHTTLKDGGSNKEASEKKAYAKWTGENWSSGTTLIKALDLQMISTADMINNLKEQVSVIAAAGVLPQGSEHTIDYLEPQDLLGSLFHALGFLNQERGLELQNEIRELIPKLKITDGPTAQIDNTKTEASVPIDFFNHWAIIIRVFGAFGERDYAHAISHTTYDFLQGDINIAALRGYTNLNIKGNRQAFTLKLTYTDPNAASASIPVGMQVWYLDHL